MTKILGGAFKALVGSGTAVALVLGSGGITGTAYAVDLGGNSKFYESCSAAMPETDVAKLAEDLEALFTKYIPQVDGKYVANEEAIIEDGYADQLEDFRTVAATFNDTSNRSGAVFSAGLEGSRGVATTNSAGSYAKCVVLGALGIPASAFTYGTWTAITTAISACFCLELGVSCFHDCKSFRASIRWWFWKSHWRSGTNCRYASCYSSVLRSLTWERSNACEEYIYTRISSHYCPGVLGGYLICQRLGVLQSSINSRCNFRRSFGYFCSQKDA